MKLHSKASFHRHFEPHGIALDAKYAAPQTLEFIGASDFRWTWRVPSNAKDWPRWITSLFDASKPEKAIYLYPRQNAWARGFDLQSFQTSSVFHSMGVDPGSDDVIEATTDERDAIETLFFLALLHGGTVSDDIFAIPDHGKVILYADHHEAVHASFSDRIFMNQMLGDVIEAK
jgi:hypothetical protein